MTDPYRTAPFRNERLPCKICGKQTGLRMTFPQLTHDTSWGTMVMYGIEQICSDECADKLGGAREAEIEVHRQVTGQDPRQSTSSTSSSASGVDVEAWTNQLFGVAGR